MQYSVLIADAEKNISVSLENILRGENNKFVIFEAFDFNQILDIAIKKLPDVILLNWENPAFDSNKIVSELKNNNLTTEIPLIAFASDIYDDRLKNLISSGTVEFIKIPTDDLLFVARIKSAVKMRFALKELENQRDTINISTNELNKLSFILKETTNSVIIFNKRGEIEWGNEGFRKMYGISIQDFIKKYDRDLHLTKFIKQTAEEKFREVLNTQKSVTYVTNVRDFNSLEKRWIQTTLTPVLENGVLTKVVAIETDITKAKQSELDLIKKNKEMKQMTEELKTINEKLEKQKELIEVERKKSEELVESILPHHIAVQLKSIGYAKPRNYRIATILFADFKDFTKLCKNLSPSEIVEALHKFFTHFDDIVVKHYIEKIKTIGDAYMCVGGIPLRNRSNPFDVVIGGLKMQYFMNNLDLFDKEKELPRWKIRLGVHTGPLVAGVVGKIKYAYDVWGDSVNIASRMETAGEVGRVNISASTYEYVKEYFECEHRGKLDIKNRGKMAMYFVNRIKPEYSANEAGTEPNNKFKDFLHQL